MSLRRTAKRRIRSVAAHWFGQSDLATFDAVAHCVNHLKRRWLKSSREPDMGLLERFVGPGDTCFDIGANVGLYTAHCAHLVGKGGRVLSFEPVSYTFSVLSKVIRYLRLNNVELHRVALGDEDGEATLVVPFIPGTELPDAPSARIATGDDIGLVEIAPMRRLDDFLPTLECRRVSLVKCDAEGAELYVFRGATELLRRHRPVVLCEIAARLTTRYGHRPQDVFAFFEEQGYQAFRLTDGRLERIADDADRPGNYWFLPSESTRNIAASCGHQTT